MDFGRMVRRLAAGAALAVAALCGGAGPAYAEIPAVPAGYISDAPDALDRVTESALGTVLANLDQSFQRPIMVAVVRSTDNLGVDRYAEVLHGRWAATRPQLRDGALIVVGVNLKVAAIHPGANAVSSGAFTQEDADRIEREHLRPSVSRREFTIGVSQAVGLVASDLGSAVATRPPVTQDDVVVPKPFAGLAGVGGVGSDSWRPPTWLFAVIPVLVALGFITVLLRSVLGIGRTIVDAADAIGTGATVSGWQNAEPVLIESRRSRAGDAFGARPGV